MNGHSGSGYRMRFLSGTTGRITLAFLGYATVIQGIMIAILMVVGLREIEKVALLERSEQAAEKASALLSWLDDLQIRLTTISQWRSLPDLISQLDGGQLDAPARATLRLELARWAGSSLGYFQSIVVLDPETGVVIVASDPNEEGKILRSRTHFQEVVSTQRPYLQSPSYSLSLEAVTITLAHPIYGLNGELIGVLAADTILDGLDRIIGRQSGALPSNISYIVNGAQLFVTQPPGLTDAAALRRPNFSLMAQTCTAGNTSSMVAEDYRSVTVIAAFVWLDEPGLCVISQVDRADVVAGAGGIALTILIVGTVTLAIGSIIAALLARTLARPIVSLATAARAVREGAVTTIDPKDGSDEIQLLAREFNGMVHAVATRENELRRSNQELQEFAYVASHDLQEPLRKITAFGNLLNTEKSDQVDSEGKTYINYMVDAASRMQVLINALLLYSRLTTKAELFSPTALDDVLATVLDDLSLAITESGGSVRAERLPTVLADSQQMARLFLNLVGNALKFRKPGVPPKVQIRASLMDGGTVWRIEIQDNGIGFDPKFVDEIFKPFRRLHSRSQYAGTGMGLAICRKIVERHGGTIAANSHPGEGTTISIDFPAMAAGLV